MEKELNLVELLKNVPEDTKLYSPVFGECELKEVRDNKIIVASDTKGYYSFHENGNIYKDCGECLLFPSKENRDWSTFKVEKEGFKVGDHVKNKKTGDVCFLTNKAQNREGIWAKRINYPFDNRELYISEHSLGEYEKVSKFDPKWLKTFDRVLVRDGANGTWRAMLFSHIIEEDTDFPYIICDSAYRYCIPFNEETKHLVGTADGEPTFYKIN